MPATLGERLSAAGEELAARHLTTFPWAAGLAPALRRAAELSTSWAERFERHEADVRPPPATARRRFPSAPASPSAPEESVVTETERPLPVDVRARLGALAGPGAAVMRVLTGSAADTEVRGMHADAVTRGTEVRMRSGRLRPDTPEGLALLAHEASHVSAALRRGGAASHGTPGGADAEEREALRIERETRLSFGSPVVSAPAALHLSGGPPGTATPPSPGPNGSAPPNGTAPAAAAAAGPSMRADADRAEAGPAAAAAPALDMESLRHDLIEELMRRVRTDFERGG
ncbi:DUF4157 domain-containing protein [Actinoplanes sp. NPDC051861]|uniref:eCIS core domain-containing protein n=1 Tax=Actinoplanes sp. NPDC051861 TaxID=3155170 RepID=UPI00341C0479